MCERQLCSRFFQILMHSVFIILYLIKIHPHKMVSNPTVAVLLFLAICTQSCQSRNIPYTVNAGQDIDELNLKIFKDSKNADFNDRHKRQAEGENHCDYFLCGHGGSCENLGHSFICHCFPGFYGTYCERSGLLTEVIEEILTGINTIRSNVSPPASNMRYMTWDSTLAVRAQDLATGCYIEFLDPEYDSMAFDNESVGHLFFVSTEVVEPMQILNQIEAESVNYSFAENTCVNQCDKYKQLVNAETYAVGCGFTTCPAGIDGFSYSLSFYLVCYFREGFDSVLDPQPYVSGPPCSACPTEAPECDSTGTLCHYGSYCTSQPCGEGGSCLDYGDSYKCVCNERYYGTYCENKYNCYPNACGHGGSCVEMRHTYECLCYEGFYGMNCENEDDCHPNQCQNGGQCVDGENSYSCICPEGFSGNNCEINTNNCDPNPCENGGQCHIYVDSYTCSCPTGFAGGNCEMSQPAGGYDCEADNPCTAQNRVLNRYYFPHLTKTNFVQCDDWGSCWVMPCPGGLEWDAVKNTCDWP